MNRPPLTDELTLLEQLRNTPALLSAVEACSETERVSQKHLRARFPAELVREAIALHAARQRAAASFPAASTLWLTRVGLEQATAWTVAAHKATRFANANQVADLCCGIGSDAAALSLKSAVLAVDCSAAMVRRAEWNTAILGQADNFTGRVGDVTSETWDGWLVHADPDRRGNRPRPTRRLAEYLPGLDWMAGLMQSARGGAIKVGPASDWPQQRSHTEGCEIELISLGGECREATVWFGELAGDAPRRATNLTTGTSLAGDPATTSREVADAINDCLYEPDPAVIRAGLVDLLAQQQGFMRLAADEEYLTGSPTADTGLLDRFFVKDVLPTRIKDLRRFFRSQPRQAYEIKCRRLKVDVEGVRRQLPVGDGPPASLIFCRIAGQSRVVLADRA